MNIPAEISLIGFERLEFSEHLQPSITLIDRPVREMGELAGKMMIERIEKTYTGAARQVVFPVRLKVGTLLTCRQTNEILYFSFQTDKQRRFSIDSICKV